MQYEHTELQPIEICTQAWNATLAAGREGRRRTRRRLARTGPARPEPAGPEPLAEVRDRAGPERDVHERVELEQALTLGLGEAAADGDHTLRIALLERPRLREMGGEASDPASPGSCTC